MQNLLTMAEAPNSMQNFQVKDILSAALGQSGLNFEESEEDDVQDVFAALAADANYPSYMPRPVSTQNKPENKQSSVKDEAFGPTENFDNDLDDLMDLISSEPAKQTPQTLQASRSISNVNSDSSLFRRAPPALNITKNVQINANKLLRGLSLPALRKIEPSNDFIDLTNDLTPNHHGAERTLFSSASSSSSSQSFQPNLFAGDLSRLKIPGLRAILAEQSNKEILGMPGRSADDFKLEPGDDIEEEEEELGYAETFADYMPAKVRIGKKHPDPVVETSSMASIPPPDVWYKLSLPSEVAERSFLSALQLEAVIYACQQHEKLLPNGKRAGFLIGDGAGVGKGRTVAGIIYENYLLGRKRAIWLSVSNDLRYDALRDLRDIGCNMSVHALNKFKYDEKITSKANGKVKKGVVFSTYSSLIGETQGKARFKTRLSQLMHWCGEDYDGVIIFDECHKAKNLVPTGSGKPTKTGMTVLQLQDLLPKARVVYCSATGASEPKNMAYMNRLGIWGTGTPFKEFGDFIQSVEKRGVGAMELVAMDMKLRGMYIARQLSFAGTSFDIKEISLCDKFIDMYNASVKLWADARDKMEKAADMISLDGQIKKTIWGQFWSAHQRFFKYLCIAAKVQTSVSIAKKAISEGKCVVIGLQSTGEARTQEQLDDCGGDLNDFVSTAKGVFSSLIEKHFPVSGSRYTVKTNSDNYNYNKDSPSSDRKRNHTWNKRVHKKRKFADRESIFDSGSENTHDSSQDEIKFNDLNDSSDVNDDDDDSSGSGSNSESDEDNWLKAFSDEPKAKKKKTKKKRDSSGPPAEDSISVLNAAGFIGKKFSWASSLTGNSKAFKSNRIPKSNQSQELTKQMQSSPSIPASLSAAEQCSFMKNELLEKLEIVSPYLPPNTLDELIDELGGPDHVAEMTGRKNRVLVKDDGTFTYESRSKDDVPLELLNIAEKERFMSGEKFVAIISEAASSGISLQADRRAKNQRRRLHITLELPWSADKAIQQFGRTHRSNQVSAPEYLFLISELAGEQRFASIVAKRLESLGALTHGDRRAAESRDLSRFNFDTKYGRTALEVTLKSLIGAEKNLVPFPADYDGDFLKDAQDGLIGVGMLTRGPQNSLLFSEKDYTKVSRFLNRILGLSVASQNALFTYFMETMNTITKEAKRSGRWDEGILDLGSQGESVKKLDVKTFSCTSTCGEVTTDLLTVSIERGMPWHRAYDIFLSCTHPEEGFYHTNTARMGKKMAVLVKRAPITSKKKLYGLYRSNIGLQPKHEQLPDIQRKYTKISDVEAESLWNDQYAFSENNCTHAYWQGKCKKRILGLDCEVGMRKRTCYVLAGSVLSVWNKLGAILSTQPGTSGKMQIIRLKLDDGNKVVGVLIPGNLVQLLTRTLSGTQTDPYSILNLL